MNDTSRRSISDVSQIKFIVGNRGKIICVLCLKNQFLGNDLPSKAIPCYQSLVKLVYQPLSVM